MLCPGFVQTGIARSDRNRPAWAPEHDPATAAERISFIQAMVDAGIDPQTVADRVLDAVRDGTFYILTHPEMKPALALRHEDILEGRPPSPGPLG